MSKEKKNTLEENFEELEKVIGSLEDENISLEDSFKEYQKGIELVKACHAEIDGIEKQVQLLNENGTTSDFE